jgi:probable F420-dependent oxidoreductase
VTRVGLCLPQLGSHVTANVVRGFCESAEEIGFDSLWVQDHFLYPLQPQRPYGGRSGSTVPEPYRSVLGPTELLAAVAAWTTTPRLGTSVLVAGNHWPAPLAQSLATVDLLSGGRLDVGLGVGWNAEEHIAAGTDVATRGRRFDDFLEALLACWGEDPVEHHGAFVDVPLSIVRPKPVQSPRPPLISGMWSRAGIERTRRRFDGWNPAGWTVEAAAAKVAEMNGDRPAGMAPLTVHFRTFLQLPHEAESAADAVGRIAGVVAEAREAGFAEVIVEANFWDEVDSEASWLAVPERCRPILEAARG